MSGMLVVPKLTGADVELSNFIAGHTDYQDSVREASYALLAEIAASEGALVRGTGGSDADPQDRGRTFLSRSGGCAYLDMDHLELCLPEVRDAFDHVACWHAMLRIARDAQASANARRSPGRRIHVLANNSDGLGRTSYGAHLNVLVSRAAFDNLLYRKPHFLAYLAAFQVSSLPITGQGKVGSDNGAPPVTYQLSQRTDFFETVAGIQTTSFRPLVNTRDEPLSGSGARRSPDLARVHIIFFDTTLCHVATLLRVGATQIVLAMLEAGVADCSLALDDPVAAVRMWSHDPTLRATAPLVTGEAVTAVELQRRFHENAARFVSAGHAEHCVPRASDIVALWGDTLAKLEARDWVSLSTRLDWVLKLSLLTRALQHHPELDWDSPGIKHLDHLYSSLDPTDGLYWSMERSGLVERVVPDARIEHFTKEPPADTRAWARAMLLRRAGSAVEDVDWDMVRLTTLDDRGSRASWRIDLPDPLDAGALRLREDAGLSDTTQTIEDLVHALSGTRVIPAAAHSAWNGYASWPEYSPVLTQPWRPRLAGGAERSDAWWNRTPNNSGDDYGTS